MPGELKIGRVYRWSDRSRQPYVAVDVDRLVTWKAGVLQVVDSPEEVAALLERQVEDEPPVGELLEAWGISAGRFDQELLEVMRPRLDRIRAERAPTTRVVGPHELRGVGSRSAAPVASRVPTVGGAPVVAAPVVAAPLEVVRCRTCGEEKPWLRPGEQCAACAAPKGAPLPREVEDDEPELVEAAPATEVVAAHESEDTVMAKSDDRPKTGVCPVCGETFKQNPTGRLKIQCSTECTARKAHRRAKGLPIADSEQPDAGEEIEEEVEVEAEELEDEDDQEEEVEEEPEPEPESASRPARRKRPPARQLPAAVEAPQAPAPLPSWRALALGVLARAARGAAAIASELERRAGASS